MKIEQFVKSLDPGIYTDARRKNLTMLEYLTEQAIANGVEGVDETYKGLSRTEVMLKKRWLRENNLPVPEHVYEKILSHLGVNMNTEIKSIWTSSSVVLFPEMIAQAVHATMLNVIDYTQFCANIQRTTGLNYEVLTYTDTQPDRSFARRTDEAPFKKVNVKLSADTLHKKEYGLTLSFDYNTLQSVRFSMLKSKVLDRIGAQLGIDILDEMLYVAVNGDGVTNGLDTANNQEDTATAGAIVPDDIINFITVLDAGYKIDNAFARVAGLRKYASAFNSMSNPKDSKQEVVAQIGLDFPKVHRWDSTNLSANLILGLDTKRALNMITDDQMLLEEAEKITQLKKVETTLSTQFVVEVNDRNAIGALRWQGF